MSSWIEVFSLIKKQRSTTVSYAGMIRFRFEGCFSVPFCGDTPTER
jgi:hypothetical protein